MTLQLLWLENQIKKTRLLFELFIFIPCPVQLYSEVVPLLCALVQLSEDVVQLLLQGVQLAFVVAEIQHTYSRMFLCFHQLPFILF